MGVNAAALGLMALARAEGADFARVMTLGRQGVHLPPPVLAAFFRRRGREDIAAQLLASPGDGYCEHLLKLAFGAQEVVSLDASDYENASLVHDMNTPLKPAAQFPVVLDLGTLEHVFNVAVAFDNVAALCAAGGHILHVLPGNNLSGHGFYQFSPEMFFQIYSEQRGYANTRVFAAPEGNPEVWYEVRAPHDLRKRVDITSRDQLYILALTQKLGAPTPLAERAVQQSDYLALWGDAVQTNRKSKRSGGFRLSLLDGLRHRVKVARRDVAVARADMVRRRVLDLIPRF